MKNNYSAPAVELCDFKREFKRSVTCPKCGGKSHAYIEKKNGFKLLKFVRCSECGRIGEISFNFLRALISFMRGGDLPDK